MTSFNSTHKDEKIVAFDGLFKNSPNTKQMRDPLKTDWNAQLASENAQLLQLIDFSQLSSLFDNFLVAMGLPVAIIDLQGTVLASSKWQRVCVEFHRAHADTLNRCLESDRSIHAQLNAGKTYVIHHCSNGLIDCAAPIIIENCHLANLFIGQFFDQPPNLEFFKQQQQAFGFDESSYFAAIAQVPIVDKEKLPALMALLVGWAEQIAACSLAEKRAIAALASVEQQVKERTEELAKSHTLLDTFSREVPGVLFQLQLLPNGQSCFPFVSQEITHLFAITAAEIKNDSTALFARIHRKDCVVLQDSLHESAQTLLPWHQEFRVILPDHGVRWYLADAKPEAQTDGSIIWYGFISDITDNKQVASEVLSTKNQLQATLDAIPDLLFEIDLLGTFHDYHARSIELLAVSADEFLGKRVIDVLPADVSHTIMLALDEALQQGWSMGKQFKLELTQGVSWFELSVAIKSTTDRELPRFIVLARDITERKSVEDALRNSQALLRTAQRAARMGHYVTDLRTRTWTDDEIFAEIFGIDSSFIRDFAHWYTILHEDDLQRIMEVYQQGLGHHDEFASVEYRIIRPSDGALRWIGAWGHNFYDNKGNPVQQVGMIQDITDRKATEQHINQLAFYDPLTQLPNRRLLQERLKHSIDVSHRTGSQIAVLMMDLDKFKAVNDNLGHAAGDELLQQVAERVKSRLREVDTLARLGGDEFIVLIEDVSHYERVAHIADDIIHALSLAFTLYQNIDVHIGTSIGIAIYPQHGDSVEALMDNADTALYHAKDNGRGCFAYFSQELTQKARERIALENRLRNAIEQQELHVYFQPQIAINSGKISGAEALVRWHDPERGCLMPTSFIALAEETGLIIALGEWVLRETCRLGRQWLDAGLPPVILAVNVSPYQFRHCDINSLVSQVLLESGFPAKYLELEITESGLMDNQEHAMDILNKLHEQGVLLAIDDFGTGYSSLAYLKYFPVDILKIDKTFIDDIPFLKSDMAITATIIAMADRLGFKVLAEGVESYEQLVFLQLHGCDFYQGYLYSKALSADDFAALLASRKIQVKQ